MLLYRLLQQHSSASSRPSTLADFGPSRRNATPDSSSSTPTRVLACSALSSSSNNDHHDLIYGFHRQLCEDRRGVFDHLRPRLFIKNTIRVVVMQSTTVVTNYYNDQLKQDMEREERVQKGEITRAQANKEDDEWQEVSESVSVDCGSIAIIYLGNARMDGSKDRR